MAQQQPKIAPPGGWREQDVNPNTWADNMIRTWKVAAYQKGVSPTRNRKISLDNIGIYIWISNLQHIVFGSQFLGKSSEIALIL